jgi:hypothetical protein
MVLVPTLPVLGTFDVISALAPPEAGQPVHEAGQVDVVHLGPAVVVQLLELVHGSGLLNGDHQAARANGRTAATTSTSNTTVPAAAAAAAAATDSLVVLTAYTSTAAA